MSLNPDLLRVEFLGLTVRHDPVDMPRDDLALFFSAISERYGLSRLEYHSDGGATYSGNDGAEFVLRLSQVASCAVTNLGYREGLERVVGLVEEAVERYEIGQLWIEDVTLVAVWDVEDAELVHELLAGSLLQIDPERLGLLGGDDVAVGLRIWRRLATRPWSAPSSRCTRAVEGLHPAGSDAGGRAGRGLGAARDLRRRLRLPARAAHLVHPGPRPPLTGATQLLTVGEVQRRSAAYLAERGSPSARLDADLLLAHALGVERLALYTGAERPLTPAELDRARDLVARRPARAARLHHGRAGVPAPAGGGGPEVLVPRPETELLVEWALEVAAPGAAVLDWGTGSGAVALALANEGPALRVTALERSPPRSPAPAPTGSGSRWRSSGWPRTASRRSPGGASTSSPPTRRTCRRPAWRPRPRSRFEPHEALVAGPTGLEAVERLAAEAPAHLEPGGALLVEVGRARPRWPRPRSARPAWSGSGIAPTSPGSCASWGLRPG